MSQRNPAQVLLDEHRLIEMFLDRMEEALSRLDADAAVLETVEQVLHFHGHFTEACHHQKEESALFPMLRRKGLSETARMLLDDHHSNHEQLLALEQMLPAARQRDPEALGFLLREGRMYIHLTREHIRQEDETLFVLAAEMLDEEESAQMEALLSDARWEPGAIHMPPT